MGLELEDSPLYEPDEEIDEPGPFDDEPVPTRRSTSGKASVRNYRRSIEELQEERLLRRMLSDLDQEFPDIR